VLVHDAARCLVQPAAVERLIDACVGDAVGGLLALPLADTLKDADAQARVCATVDRRGKWAAQTPQMFRIGLLAAALDAAGDSVTDEASAIESQGHAPLLVPGDADNFKLTFPADFARAERVLASRAGAAIRDLRIGEGWDIHALVAGRPLILGGVQVPHDKGLAGHSDADALAHAITDALLGAAALGDIGRHFPDTDAAFEGADSMVLLAEAARRVRAAGYEIGNIDSTVIAQAPKLAPHIPAMCHRLAEVLGLALDQVNVKAKTAEKMGPVGEGRAIEARATCLLQRAAPPR
jgi:2-C-methyl-D-erythritol 4-phosphate cytidylyltransferase/2-C-methyl-D-erythritol 2,4-cyclodiphosphate synthase